MKMNKIELAAFIALILILIFIMNGCSTVAGAGKDITGVAEWTKDKINKSQQEPGK